jgi:ribonuclease T1
VLSTGSSLPNSTVRQAVRKIVLALAAASCVAGGSALWARESAQVSSVASTVALAELPVEAQQTDRLIRSGGPFPYGKDGSVFGNRERLLPLKPRGHYREYTVKTPGSPDRGARRIVCGGEPPVKPEACFYTADHYASFRRIVQ